MLLVVAGSSRYVSLCLLQPIGGWPYSYVYSAYIDDRRARDLSQLVVVHRQSEPSRPAAPVAAVLRVFAWVPRYMPADCPWRCLYWSRRHQLPLERPVIAWTDLNHFDSNST